MFLNKKKKAETEDNEEVDKEETRPQQPAASPGMPSVVQLSADIERIKAAIEALSEMRKVTNERFSTLSEQIGELRSSIASQERHMQTIEVKAVKAADLVSSVQPERLLVQFKRLEAKIQAINSRLESNQLINDHIREELKEIRNKIALFRGVDQILKLNEEVKKELRGIQKVKAETERNADKVETIFIEVEKSFSEFKRFKDMVNNISEQSKEVLKQLDSMKLKFNTFATKTEFEKFMNKVNEKEAKLENYLKIVDQATEKISSLSEQLDIIQQDHAALMEVHERMHLNFERINGWINYLKERVK